ncbi:MAG: hypothetical protein AB9903_23620 [Vulcanimicrobiota bacterium]
MKQLLFSLALIFFLLPQALSAAAKQESTFNFTYLEAQRTRIVSKSGKEWRIWASYDEKTSKARVKTEVVARIALLYSLHFEKSQESISLQRAKEAIDFLESMEDEEGLFYTWMNDDGSLEKAGTAIYTYEYAYTFWALCRGYRIFSKSDPSYAAKLEAHITKTVDRLKTSLSESDSYGKYKNINGIDAPEWLISGRSDLTSIFVLGLLEYYVASPNADIKDLISNYCNGIRSFQSSTLDCFPFGAHYESTENLSSWTLAHNRQISALALAGEKFGSSEWVNSAAEEVYSLYTHFLTSYGPWSGMSPCPIIYPEEPSSAEVMTSNLISMLKVTGKEPYALLAGLSASWLSGNNSKKEVMFDMTSGKGYDRLTEKGRSSTSGIEATVEALTTLVAAWNTPAWQNMEYREASSPHSFVELEAEEGKAVRKDYEIEECIYPGATTGKYVVIKRENSFWIKFDIVQENEYAFYLTYLKQPGIDLGTSIMMRVDGDKIFTIPLGGAPENSYMAMKEVMEPRLLLPGPHSMGIRYSGLLHSKGATVDNVLVQPLVEWRIFDAPSTGQKLIVLKSFYREDRDFALQRLGFNNLLFQSCSIYSRVGSPVIKKTDLSSQNGIIRLPAHGFAILRGK